MEIIDISPKIILAEVIRKLGLPVPIYDIEMNEERYVRSFVEVIVNRGDPPHEAIRTMDLSRVKQLKSKEQTAIYAFNILKY